MTVPNQKVLTISKIKPVAPFLQLEEADWKEAFQKLTRTEFGIYLLLAQNADGFKFEYSPQAIANSGMMSKGQASKVLSGLREKGYIKDNIFYVQSPARRAQRDNIQKEIDKITGQS